jgi:hypothetical protein
MTQNKTCSFRRLMRKVLEKEFIICPISAQRSLLRRGIGLEKLRRLGLIIKLTTQTILIQWCKRGLPALNNPINKGLLLAIHQLKSLDWLIALKTIIVPITKELLISKMWILKLSLLLKLKLGHNSSKAFSLILKEQDLDLDKITCHYMMLL